MSETPWAHLPNARVIDEILADAAVRPQVWADAWNSVSTQDREAAWQVAHTIVTSDAFRAVWDAVWEVVWGRAKGTARSTAWLAISTLIAWPSSADLLALTPDALRTIIDTCDGDVRHQAVLLLPAVIAQSA